MVCLRTLALGADAEAFLCCLQYKVKMVTADDEQTTDIITEGDVEETTRFCRVRCWQASHQTWWLRVTAMHVVC